MPNTNNQTIHQFGAGISQIVRQATGRDSVESIGMDWVTVEQTSKYYEISGDVISFYTTLTDPMKVIADIKQVQDLHGYANPWVGGAGKNLLDDSQVKHGAYTAEHIWSASGDFVTYEVETLLAGTYTFSTDLETCYITRYFVGSTATEVGAEQNSITFTLSETDSFTICMRKNPASDISTLTPKSMIELGSSATTYAPYSNICPISGWTECNIYVSSTANPDNSDKVTYEVEFPNDAGTIYGGTLTVNDDGSGKLVVDRAKVILQNLTPNEIRSYTTLTNCVRVEYYPMRTLGKVQTDYISDKFKSQSKTPTDPYEIGRSTSSTDVRCFLALPLTFDTSEKVISELNNLKPEICYYLATPVTYNLSEVEVINSLKGINYVWADTGPVSVKYITEEEF